MNVENKEFPLPQTPANSDESASAVMEERTPFMILIRQMLTGVKDMDRNDHFQTTDTESASLESIVDADNRVSVRCGCDSHPHGPISSHSLRLHSGVGKDALPFPTVGTTFREKEPPPRSPMTRTGEILTPSHDERPSGATPAFPCARAPEGVLSCAMPRLCIRPEAR